MGKLGTFGLSLVGAIPAGFLTYLLVMNFLNRSEQMTGMFLIVTGATVLLTGFLTLLPILVLIFQPSQPMLASASGAAPRSAAPAAAAAAPAAAASEDFGGGFDDGGFDDGGFDDGDDFGDGGFADGDFGDDDDFDDFVDFE